MAQLQKIAIIGLGVIGQRMLTNMPNQGGLQVVRGWDLAPKARAKATRRFSARHMTCRESAAQPAKSSPLRIRRQTHDLGRNRTPSNAVTVNGSLRAVGPFVSILRIIETQEHPVMDFAGLYARRFGFEAPANETDSPLPDAALGILARRSIRRYRSDPVPDGLLDALLACAQSAPTKSNLQQYSILVLRNREKRKRLSDILPTMQWAAEAPVFLSFLGDVRRGRRLAELRGYEHRNDNVDTFMNAAVDAGLAMQCFIDAAEAAGLGCCPISMVRNDLDALTELLELPSGVFPIAGLSAGWPEEDGRISMRLPPSVVVHRDRYDDGRLEEEVAAYDERVFAVAPIPPEKQRHADRYGIADRGVWSENVARQLSLPERAGFRDWLRRQGLNLD